MQPSHADPADVTAVILAGGAGTRLWPLSRSAQPKHLLQLVPHDPPGDSSGLAERTLLRATYERAVMVAQRVVVITERTQLAQARAQLPELGDDDWFAEPARRGTAACLGLAAALLPPDGLMISLHADHLIPDHEAFARAATDALAWARDTGSLLTLGVTPNRPATGFGYLHGGEWLEAAGRGPARRAVAFVEKPPLDDAVRMVTSGEYLWNTGIFAWRNRSFITQMSETAPEIARGSAIAAEHLRAGRSGEFDASYLEIPEMAVDHAVMERTHDLLVVPADFAWSDVGNWADLRDVLSRNAEANAAIGDVVFFGTRESMVIGGERLIALLGVSDLVVVDTPDAILVCSRERAQEVKDLVLELKRMGREELL